MRPTQTISPKAPSERGSKARGRVVLALAALCGACGMRSSMSLWGGDADIALGPGDSTSPTGAAGNSTGGATAGKGTGGHSGVAGIPSATGGTAGGLGSLASGGRVSTGGTFVAGGTSTVGHGGSGGSGGIGIASGGSTGKGGSGGASSMRPDASSPADAKPAGDAAAQGTPAIDPNSGYTTIATGTVTMSGYVSLYIGGSGSSISLSYTATTFCATGTVGASSTYNSWAGAGFNVNQDKSGSSGSTNPLVLVGSTISISYVNYAGSTLQFQLWDGSDYWCYQLPRSTVPNTVTLPFSSLNTKCWDNTGTAFLSGTPITTVQLDVPGSATTPTPFDYCFLGLTVQ